MAKEPFDKEDIDERMCRLNTALYEAAKWIEKRARQAEGTSWINGGYRGNGLSTYTGEKPGFFDGMYGLDDDPAFNPDDEYGNLVAKCINSTLLSHEKYWSAPYFGNLPEEYNVCCLFHDIYENGLYYNFDTLGRVGEIEVNLVECLHRNIYLQPELKLRKLAAPHSVFCQSDYYSAFEHLTPEEYDYARLLNQKLKEANAWIESQARHREKEYRAFGGVDGQTTDDNAYEDYEMFVNIEGSVGEKHPDYDEDDNYCVVRHYAPIVKESQRICGRGRNLSYNGAYSYYAPYYKLLTPNIGLWNVCQSRLAFWHRPHSSDKSNAIHTCGLFWNIFKKLGHDWFKMLSINELHITIYFVQRRIIQI